MSTTIKFYPLFSNYVNIENIKYYAAQEGLTVKSNHSTLTLNGKTFALLEVNQILGQTAKDKITAVFNGTAYVEFS